MASPARSWSGEPRNTCFTKSGWKTITKPGSNSDLKVTMSPYLRRFRSIQGTGAKMNPIVCIQRGRRGPGGKGEAVVAAIRARSSHAAVPGRISQV